MGDFCIVVLYPSLLHLPLLRFHCVGVCWFRTEDCCGFGFGTVRRSVHSARLKYVDLINIWVKISSILAFGCWLACRKCRIWQLGRRNTHPVRYRQIVSFTPSIPLTLLLYNLQRKDINTRRGPHCPLLSFRWVHPRGVTKRCRLPWLINCTHSMYMSPNAGGRGEVATSQPMSTAVHRSPNIL
jgi:hypothetical protein